MSFHCPKCNRVVYSRRQNVCGFCGAELPKQLQLTEAELEGLAKQDAEAEARRKVRKLHDEEEDEHRRGDPGDLGAASMM